MSSTKLLCLPVLLYPHSTASAFSFQLFLGTLFFYLSRSTSSKSHYSSPVGSDFGDDDNLSVFSLPTEDISEEDEAPPIQI